MNSSDAFCSTSCRAVSCAFVTSVCSPIARAADTLPQCRTLLGQPATRCPHPNRPPLSSIGSPGIDLSAVPSAARAACRSPPSCARDATARFLMRPSPSSLPPPDYGPASARQLCTRARRSPTHRARPAPALAASASVATARLLHARALWSKLPPHHAQYGLTIPITLSLTSHAASSNRVYPHGAAPRSCAASWPCGSNPIR